MITSAWNGQLEFANKLFELQFDLVNKIIEDFCLFMQVKLAFFTKS